jgi:preprotein translocase subunit SecA
VTGATEEGFPEEWDLDRLWTAFRELYHPTITVNDVIEEAGGERAGLSRDFLIEIAKEDAQRAYDAREEDLTPDRMRELERQVVLAVLDRKWREHLYEMDYLREGIGLRAMAQRDPLIEYQREGYDLFNNMMEGIKEDSVGHLFNLQPEFEQNPIVEDAAGADVAAPLGLRQAPPDQRLTPAGSGGPVAGNAPGNGAPRGRHAAGGRGAQAGGARGAQADAQANGQPGGAQPGGAQPGGAVVAPGLNRPQRPARLSYSAPSADGGGQVERRTESASGDKFAKVGRNAPCPCGSGRKYKLCHGDPRNRANG